MKTVNVHIPENKVFVTPKYLASIFAGYAVRQSPYLVPDNLKEAIFEFMAGFDCTASVLIWRYPLEFSQAVRDSLMKSPICLSWNERKNGRCGMGFSSRYDQPSSDDDFINLGDLQMNICGEVFKDQSWQTNQELHLKSGT
jgi:hypothetical protein